MIYTVPDYYKEFHCLADKCEDTCCAGWQIVIDKKSLAKYRNIAGAFRKRMKKSVDWKNSTFKQSEDKRCAFLNENNLCDMQLALGEKSLCKTCRRYPRHVEEFENVREITLSLSCPEVARILLNKKEQVKLLSVEKEEEEEYEDFDPFLYSELVEAREVMRKILQDRSKEIRIRAGLILGLAHDMQIRINRGEMFTCEEVYLKYQKERAALFVEERLKERNGDWRKNYQRSWKTFRKLYRLELLREDWDAHLKETEYLLFGNGAKGYQNIQEEFEDWISENWKDFSICCEQLLVYFIDTYFCGAVYDGRAYSKVRMAVVSVFYIYEMLKARWCKNDKMLDREDVIMIVYRYSREIEHSDRNLELMERYRRFLEAI